LRRLVTVHDYGLSQVRLYAAAEARWKFEAKQRPFSHLATIDICLCFLGSPMLEQHCRI
jgi:hypothetical protein